MKMIRNRILLKTFAAFFILEMVVSTVAPTISWALTAGPTAPEATSFEPVDTTDMVNIATGDFTYNLPLIEVPGPSGGYPLSLSYHAGIQPNVDASWVGLGFTLNPGAINRSVNGYADDFKDVIGTDRSFWEGGESKSVTIGVNIGYANSPSSVSAGLTFAEDTYRGFGVGGYVGISGSFAFGPAKLGINSQYGVSPYGGSASSTGIGLGIGKSVSKSMNLDVNASFSLDQNGKASTDASVGLSRTERNPDGTQKSSSSMLDASISSQGGSPRVSAGGGMLSGGVHNARAGRVSTSGYDYQVNIPTPWNFSIRLGKSYQRYWTDEKVDVATNGSLYFPTSSLPTSSQLNKKAYDVYDLIDVSALVDKAPDERLAGSFTDYDSYQVLGQGISGSIRPYHFNSYLLRQNKKDGSKYRVKAYPLGTNKKAEFRFIGDFSNKYIHNSGNDHFTTSTTPPLSFQFDPNRLTGENGNDGYDEVRNILPGSKSIDWFSDSEIRDKGSVDSLGNSIPPGVNSAINRGFLDCKARGFFRSESNKIGGFKVVNESGVTYHYALPVMSYNEYTYSGKKDEKNKHHFNTYKKNERYAYTWLLTAVTGPDFVDHNGNGYADKGDWGYWVVFEYGKWSDRYSWRNPAEGFNKDVDQGFKSFSKGTKEVYYLDMIKTATHTALFAKEIRLDAKSVVHEMDGAVDVDDHTVQGLDDGGFNAKSKLGVLHLPGYGWGIRPYTEHPVSLLRLANIYLLKNEELENITTNVQSLSSAYIHYDDAPGSVALAGKYILGKYVFDVFDAQTNPLKSILTEKAIRTISFNVDYSLVPGTANSFKSAIDPSNLPSGTAGKLTLKSISFGGHKGVSLIPDVKFKYDTEENYFAARHIIRTELVSLGSASTIDNHYLVLNDGSVADFSKGEILKIQTTSEDYFGYVAETKPQSSELKVVPIHGDWSDIQSNSQISFKKTKNPPYNEEYYDMWGFYKVDYNNSSVVLLDGALVTEENENAKRMVTSTSAEAIDVWSLQEITTSLGAKININYESDTYKNSLKTLANIPIKNLEKVGSKTRIVLYESPSEYGLSIGDIISFRFLTALKYKIDDAVETFEFKCVIDDETNEWHKYVYHWDVNSDIQNMPIEVLGDNSFIVNFDLMSSYPLDPNKRISRYQPYELLPSDECNMNTCLTMNWVDIGEPIFLGGEVLSKKFFSPYGGGLRVKEVTLRESAGRSRSTLYEYTNGVTPYEPVGFELPIHKIPKSKLYPCLEEMQNDAVSEYMNKYINSVYQEFKGLFANSRELPSPGVIYGKVVITEKVQTNSEIVQVGGRSEYEFEVMSPTESDGDGNVFSEGIVKATFSHALGGYLNWDWTPDPVTTILDLPVHRTLDNNRTLLVDYSAILGSLKSIKLYDRDGNIVTETINHYLHDDFNYGTYGAKVSSYKDQGKIVETFADARIIADPDEEEYPNRYMLTGLLSQKVKYPVIQIGQTSTNYKTGITTHSEILGFDFYSGQQIKTKATDGYGNVYLTEVMPAYRVIAYNSGMGLAYQGGKNMLTQEASTFTYKVSPGDNNNKLGLVFGSVQTWSDQIPALEPGAYIPQTANQQGIWRKHANFSFIGDDNIELQNDGLHSLPVTEFSAWNKTDLTPSNWRKDSEITLYDVHSHALEAKDLNDQYAATKMSFDQSRVMATAANAEYSEFGYSGAEYIPVNGQFGNDVHPGNQYDDFAHTGLKSIKAQAGNRGFTFYMVPKQRTYHVSVWSTEPTCRIKYMFDTNNPIEEVMVKKVGQAGAWYLLEADINIEDSWDRIEIWCEAKNAQTNFDDFRVCPVDATMISYVYNEWGELSHILDNGNLYTEYIYDEMGRLKEVHKETFQAGRTKVSETKYHYANK